MTAPTPDPFINSPTLWTTDRIWEAQKYFDKRRLDDGVYVRDIQADALMFGICNEYEQHIAAQAATIEQLEADAHIAETKFQQQSMILEQQAAEIKLLRAQLAAAHQQEAMPVPDWASAPEWANWWAANAGKTMGWYELKPIIITGDPYWSEQHGRKLHANMLTDLPIGVDWRTTLVARPAAQPKQGEE